MNEEFEEEGSLVAIAEPGTTLAKIQSRLLSSKFLSTQITTSLEALKVLLNPALKQNGPGHNAHHASSDKGIERPSGGIGPLLDPSLKQNEPENNACHASSDEGSEQTSCDIGPDDTQEDEYSSNQESESKDNETHVKAKKLKPSKPGKVVKSLSSKNESTFLPSLSVGFVRGGSDDSDWSRAEDEGTDPEPKKNRRGQRARRA